MSEASARPSACENCASETSPVDLMTVHRVYLELDEWDKIRHTQVVEEIESWCIACRSIYPFEPA